jgi:hypothetical protein
MVGPGPAGYCMFFIGASVVYVGLLFIFDAVRLSHRVVGPLYRFRKTIQAITAGEEVERVSLRKDDFLQELKDDINEMLRVLQERGAVQIKTTEADAKQSVLV